MKGIILPSKKITTKLEIDDIVLADKCYYTIVKIDPRYGKKEGETDNEYKYFVKSKVNGELMNFTKDELTPVVLGVYDYDKYYNHNIRFFLGNLKPDDMKELKYAVVLKYNLKGIEDVYPDDLIELSFMGEQINDELTDYENTSFSIPYFKLNKQEISI